MSLKPSHCFTLLDVILSERKRAQTVVELSVELEIPQLGELVRRFLFQMFNTQDPRDLIDVPLSECPMYDGKVKVLNAASAMFYAPSDISGVGGMRREIIRSNPSWRHGSPRLDCAFVTTDPEPQARMQGMDIVRIHAFFSFKTQDGEYYPCAVVRWFNLSDEPDEDTGMWIVRPGFNTRGRPDISVIHVDAIYRAAHLIPVYGTQETPPEIGPHHSYDVFRSYYVNRYADHHAFEIAS